MNDSPAPALTPGEQISLAVSAGILAATGELAVLAIRKLGFHTVLHLGPDVIWMAPLSDAVLFLFLGLTIVVVVAIASRLRVPGLRRAGVFATVFAAATAVILAIPGLHPIARLVLAAGVSASLSARIADSPRAMRAARRAAAALAILLALAGIAGRAGRSLHERRAIAALPAAASGARNVLIIIWDTVRSSSLGLYGSARPTTPRLERLASQGITFDHAFATAPWTLTSHASFFTGRFPYELSADIRTPLDATYPTVAERLRDRGFATAGFIANSYYCDRENGLARGFLHYEDFEVSPGEVLIASTFGRALSASARVRRLTGYYDIVARRTADDISAAFLRWVGRRPERPFFAFLNYYDAHLPYLPPEPWRSKFGPQGAAELWRLDHAHTRTAELFGRSRMTPAQKQELLDAYEGAIAYMDDRLGMVLDSLERMGVLRNTVVIVASDHGEHFGEHGIFGHNRSLYAQETHVPLVIRVPGDSGGRRVPTPVSLREIASTVLDLAGDSSRMPGASLTRFWRGTGGAAEDTVLSQFAQLNLSAIASGQHHFVRDRTGTMHLFSLTNDPREETDLVTTTDGQRIAADLGARFAAALAATPLHPADRAALQQ